MRVPQCAAQISFVYASKSAYYLKNQSDDRLYHNVTDQIFNELNVLKHYLILIIGAFLFLWATSCNSPSSSDSSDSAVLNSLTISPSSVQFGPQSLIGDTTLTIDLQVFTSKSPETDLLYTVERAGVLTTEGTFQQESETSYVAQFVTLVNTSSNLNYTVYVYQADNSSGQRLQGQLRIRGRLVSPPVIEEAFNTEEATIPESGNQRIDFFAEVFHPDGQELIERVNFFFINQSGERNPENSINDFRMFDDGVFNEVEGLIDETAGDSLYSRAFFINPGNSPDEITVNYYAIGADGQSSDTLRTNLSIIE